MKRCAKFSIGEDVYIPNFDGAYSGDWGTIVDIDGDYHYVAFAGDSNSVLEFTAPELRKMRK